MTKKIIITVGSLILFVCTVFFGDYFDLNFSEDQSETLLFLFKVYLGASLISFILSEIFKNYSQVDKLWSTIPIFYVVFYIIIRFRYKNDFDVNNGIYMGITINL